MSTRYLQQCAFCLMLIGMFLWAPARAERPILLATAEQENDAAARIDLVVAAAQLIPFIVDDESAGATGAIASKINEFLTLHGVNYSYYFGSWGRVLQEASVNSDVLIANLTRTPAREELYHWILPLQERSEYLFVKKGGPFEGLDREGVLASGGVAVCLRMSMQCDVLREIGFPESRIRQMVDDPDLSFASLILDERFAFWIKGDNELAIESAAHGVESSVFAPLFHVGTSVSYLAAPLNVNPEILAVLMKDDDR